MDRKLHAYLAALAVMGILLAAIVNGLFNPQYLWFYHAAFALLWLPLAALSRRNLLEYSLAGSLLTVAYLAATNLLASPGHPWALYACWPVFWWPIVIALGRRSGTLWFALLCGAATTAWYTALNVFVSPGYPWAIYPVFAVAWWPMTLLFARRRHWFGYSAAGTLLTAVFFITVNLVSSPATIWAVFPVFAVAWWPLSMYWFWHRRKQLIN